MVEKQKQKMRYSDEELSIIRNSFAENDELLKAIRKVFLQLPLSAVEQAMIINLKNQPELLKVIRKAYLPTLDGDAPFNQVVDLWMTMEIKDKTFEEAVDIINARKLLIDYIEQQLSVLGGAGIAGGIVLDDLLKFNANSEIKISNFIMRNSLIAHSEMQLNMFSVLAERKDESVEDMKKRIFKDSSK